MSSRDTVRANAHSAARGRSWPPADHHRTLARWGARALRGRRKPGLPPWIGAHVRASLHAAFEQWDGHGFPNGAVGEQVPLAARVVFPARDVEVLQRLGGLDRTRATVRRRRGAAYDPEVTDAFLGDAPEILGASTRLLFGRMSCYKNPHPTSGSTKPAWTHCSRRSRISWNSSRHLPRDTRAASQHSQQRPGLTRSPSLEPACAGKMLAVLRDHLKACRLHPAPVREDDPEGER
jgi:hypothetical protein